MINSEKKKKFSFVKFGVFIILIILSAFVLLSVFREEAALEEEFLAPVITIKPINGVLDKTLRITSQVETGRLITVAPRVGGTLISLNVNSGDVVYEGQLIAQVDSTPFELTFAQAQSAYITAQSTYEMIRELYQSQGVSRQNYENALMAYEVARAQFNLAQLNMDYTRIRAPMSATVLMRHGTQGGLVATGTPLVTLGDLGDLRIKAAIPEIHYRFFAQTWETMPVRIHAPALGENTFDVKPLSLAPYVSPENRSFLVEFEIPNGESLGLRPGMFINVIFSLDKREDIYYLPFNVITSGNRVWYVTDDNRSQYIEFTPEFFNNDFFQIPYEYRDMIFILEGQHFIGPGQKLNILSGAPQVTPK